MCFVVDLFRSVILRMCAAGVISASILVFPATAQQSDEQMRSDSKIVLINPHRVYLVAWKGCIGAWTRLSGEGPVVTATESLKRCKESEDALMASLSREIGRLRAANVIKGAKNGFVAAAQNQLNDSERAAKIAEVENQAQKSRYNAEFWNKGNWHVRKLEYAGCVAFEAEGAETELRIMIISKDGKWQIRFYAFASGDAYALKNTIGVTETLRSTLFTTDSAAIDFNRDYTSGNDATPYLSIPFSALPKEALKANSWGIDRGENHFRFMSGARWPLVGIDLGSGLID